MNHALFPQKIRVKVHVAGKKKVLASGDLNMAVLAEKHSKKMYAPGAHVPKPWHKRRKKDDIARNLVGAARAGSAARNLVGLGMEPLAAACSFAQGLVVVRSELATAKIEKLQAEVTEFKKKKADSYTYAGMQTMAPGFL